MCLVRPPPLGGGLVPAVVGEDCTPPLLGGGHQPARRGGLAPTPAVLGGMHASSGCADCQCHLGGCEQSRNLNGWPQRRGCSAGSQISYRVEAGVQFCWQLVDDCLQRTERSVAVGLWSRRLPVSRADGTPS